jgi:hypothetical protein
MELVNGIEPYSPRAPRMREPRGLQAVRRDAVDRGVVYLEVTLPCDASYHDVMRLFSDYARPGFTQPLGHCTSALGPFGHCTSALGPSSLGPFGHCTAVGPFGHCTAVGPFGHYRPTFLACQRICDRTWRVSFWNTHEADLFIRAYQDLPWYGGRLYVF